MLLCWKLYWSPSCDLGEAKKQKKTPKKGSYILRLVVWAQISASGRPLCLRVSPLSPKSPSDLQPFLRGHREDLPDLPGLVRLVQQIHFFLNVSSVKLLQLFHSRPLSEFHALELTFLGVTWHKAGPLVVCPLDVFRPQQMLPFSAHVMSGRPVSHCQWKLNFVETCWSKCDWQLFWRHHSFIMLHQVTDQTHMIATLVVKCEVGNLCDRCACGFDGNG